MSSPASAPVSGLSRAFSSCSLTTRMRSTVGLKLMSHATEGVGEVTGPPTTVAAPVSGLIV